MKYTAGNFVALHRGDVTDALQEKYPEAFLLLCQIARRARYTPCPVMGLKVGEALIGDWKKAGLKTARRYRTAKKRLKACGIATFRTTNKGTIATLVNSSVFSVTVEQSDKPSDKQVTSERQAGDKQVTTNNKENNETKKTTTTTAPEVLGVEVGNVSHFVVKVNSLKPEWDSPRNWGDAELKALTPATQKQMGELTESQWATLAKYLAYNPRKGEQYWQPYKRLRFIESFGSVMEDMKRWQSKQPAKGNPSGDFFDKFK